MCIRRGIPMKISRCWKFETERFEDGPKSIAIFGDFISSSILTAWEPRGEAQNRYRHQEIKDKEGEAIQELKSAVESLGSEYGLIVSPDSAKRVCHTGSNTLISTNPIQL